MKILGGATTADSFHKAYKASETRKLLRNEWFNNPSKLDFPNRERMKNVSVNFKTTNL